MVSRLVHDANLFDAVGVTMYATTAVREAVAVDVKPLNELSHRDIVTALELEMFKLPQLALPVTHYFTPGLYARELFIPAGTFLTGKIHKHEHLCVMSQGDMTVLLENGIRRIQAPFTCKSPPGTKRIAYAHSDTIWTTFHATTETDIDKIEELLTAKDEADYLAFVAQDAKKCLS